MKKRKIEVHRLTISGLDNGTSYAQFLVELRRRFHSRNSATLTTRTKSHLLWDCRELKRDRVRLLFLSFARGFRPDILDTTKFEVSKTPLSENQTGVEWTHCLGGPVGNHFLLLVEKHQGGIYPRSIEHYLNWLIRNCPVVPIVAERDQEQDIVVSIEAEPGEAFIDRLSALDRVTGATFRIVRPNPGWSDLENELGSQAEASNAHKADISMRSPRSEALNKNSGIVDAIKKRFRERELDFARIEGLQEGRRDVFDTEHLGQHTFVDLSTDESGQIVHADAWREMRDFFDELM